MPQSAREIQLAMVRRFSSQHVSIGHVIAYIGTESTSDALEAMPTMGGLPSIYWPFIAIGIWHFVTATGGNQLGCHLTSDTLKTQYQM